MIVLYIFLVLVLVLAVLAFVRVGVLVEYKEEGLVIRLKISKLNVQVFPFRKKEKKPAEKKSGAFTAEKLGGTFEMVRRLLPVIVDAAGGLKKRISVDDFEMDVMWRAKDPFKCALGFGAANAAVGMFWPMIEQNFCVKERRIRTFLDFRPGTPSVDHLLVQMTMRIWELTVWSVRLARGLWELYQDYKLELELEDED